MKRLLCISLLLFTAIALPVFSQTNATRSLFGIFNARYCEVIIIKRHGYKMHASVYNSLHLDTCPAQKWNQMDVAAIKKQFDASIVKLNGPRYFVMNGMIVGMQTIASPITTIGGIRFQKRAEIVTDILHGVVGSKFYAANKVLRHTIWVYNPGTTIYELIAPNGEVYVMQSYAQIVNKNLQLSDLPNLGKSLKLPTGWRYEVLTLTKPLKLSANGIAYVLNDNLYNSYQKE